MPEKKENHNSSNYLEAELEYLPDELEIHETSLVAYDENLLEHARTQWHFGDWNSLATLNRESIYRHPERAKLALLTAAAHAQLGDDTNAREYTRLAREWGCSKTLMSQILIAGVYNSLGRAAEISGQQQRAGTNFELAVSGSTGDLRLIGEARASREKTDIQNKLDILDQQTLQMREQESRRVYLETANGENQFLPGINSYAQNFEDVMLWRALKNVQNGFYIDIGAQHPVVDSVSKAFYEHGWRGIHVEPVPKYAELLRKDRPDEIVLEVLLSDSDGEQQFYNIPETGLSTGCKEIAERHRSQGFGVEEIKREQTTLDKVFERTYGREIHWLKIDVEGMEKDVLLGWKSDIRPWIVIVESTLPNSKITNHNEWERLILEKGYSFVYFDGLNRFYVHSNHLDKKNAFDTPPNVFDCYCKK